ASVFAWMLALGWVHDGLSAGSALGTESSSRRRFLIQLGGTTLTTMAAALAGVFFGARSDSLTGARWSDTHSLPNAGAPVPPLPGTRPELTPLHRHYRVD